MFVVSQRQRPGAVMGIRLVTEVLDGYHGPDARKLWLLAWAEKANDTTRAGWPTREVLARRTGRSEARASNIATELCAEGVLKRDGGGNRSGPARFVLLPLSGPEKGSARANPSSAAKSSPEPNPSDSAKGSARANPKSEVKGSESARKGSDPSPRPAETLSLPLIEPSEEQPSVPTVAADATTAQTILASFIDWVRASGGDLTRRTIGQLARQIGDLLEQDVPDRYIRKGLADWYASGHNPATFDSFANAALNAAARSRANGRAPGGHQSYRNPADQNAYKTEELRPRDH